MRYIALKRIRFHLYGFGCALILCTMIFFPNGVKAQTIPEFTTADPDRWINSKPLQKANLEGKIVLLEIWTSI